MSLTGWEVVDEGPATRISEVRSDDPFDKLMTYEEAKAAALKSLHDHVAPYLVRIEDLEQDRFRESGALPPCRAWINTASWRGRVVVAAKTKKRAIDQTFETRYGFATYWRECSGNWWHHLAREEAVWVEEHNDRVGWTGVFIKPLDRDEARCILAQHITPFRTMLLRDLRGLIGETLAITGVSSQGTPYKITTQVWRSTDQADSISVMALIDDCLGWRGFPNASLTRTVPKPPAVAAMEWANSGF